MKPNWCECCNGMRRLDGHIIVVGNGYCGYCDHKVENHEPLSVRKAAIRKGVK